MHNGRQSSTGKTSEWHGAAENGISGVRMSHEDIRKGQLAWQAHEAIRR
jgi:hypothetical protein